MTQSSRKIAALVLAAGKGTRMKSRIPKVLHPCCEVPLIVRVVRTAIARGYAPIVVVVDPEGSRIRDVLQATFPDAELVFAIQENQRGTGDAALAGLDAIPDFHGQVVTLYGDVPLLGAKTLASLERLGSKHTLALLTATLDEPAGYGRVIRDGNQIVRIVEHRDAGAQEQAIKEINVGVYCAAADLIREAVRGLDSHNAQGELYLTDAVSLAARRGTTRAMVVADSNEVRGINTRVELAEAERIVRASLVEKLQRNGVMFRDPNSVILNEQVRLAADVLVGCGVQFYGKVTVGAGTQIEGPTVIKNATIGAGVRIEAFSHVEDAKLDRAVSVGPFARIRPGSRLDEGARVGNFVELKKTHLGKGAKANHLSYIGDASVGANANIGAGTITCNYDGFRKHQTTVERGAFVGSNSTLVAPVKLGTNAYVGAGSVISEDVPRDALAIGRGRQENKKGYAKRLRDRLKKG